MLDLKLIRQNSDAVVKGAHDKGVDLDIKVLLEVDEQHRKTTHELEGKRAEQNQASKSKPTPEGLEQLRTLKEAIKELEEQERILSEQLKALLYAIPNLPLEDVPVGKDETGNVTLREVGEKPNFSFSLRDYVELGTKLDLIDTERAGKVSGSRFGYLKHEGPLLEFALVQLAMDFVTDEKNIAAIIKKQKLPIASKPFIPVIPPVLVKGEAMRAMGYMERGGDEIYHLEKDDLYLVGTSEQSVGPMHMDETFDEAKLPHRHIAFSTCFRREAGSYGKDTRGILRVHQFDKAEMFVLSTPENSKYEHQLLLAIEEALMQKLEIPYRVLNICTGDLGDPAAAKYDIEAWLPGQQEKQGEYRETHSTSNTTDFQARRLNVKVRRKNETEFVHMLNGTAFAIGRMIIAILENYQNEDGSVRVPKALQSYMGGLKEIKRS